MTTASCDIIVLAAGASSRLGQPKQLLELEGKTLLQKAIETALGSLAGRVMVVLGANEASIDIGLPDKKLYYVSNPQWSEGIASSIRTGLQYIKGLSPVADCALIMACDQPYLTTALLDKLITLQLETGVAIIASEYAGISGIPAVFSAKLFPQLMALKGDSGARQIIRQSKTQVPTIAFPMGEIDIDTKADYINLQNRSITNDH